MEEFYNLKYIDDDNNEYIVSADAKYNDEQYLLMCNLKDCDDYFIAKLVESQIEEVEDELLIQKIVGLLKTD